VGAYALESNAEDDNTAIGFRALQNNVSGVGNVALGVNALDDNTVGSNSIAIGQSALGHNTTGNLNVAVGHRAMDTNTTGGGNTAIGYGADVASPSLVNATVIGWNATVSSDNTIVLGNDQVSSVETAGLIKAGTVLYPNTKGSDGQVLGYAGDILTWINSSQIASAAVQDLEEKVAALEAELAAQREELLALVALQAERIAQLERERVGPIREDDLLASR
jgi:hypothetical protein